MVQQKCNTQHQETLCVSLSVFLSLSVSVCVHQTHCPESSSEVCDPRMGPGITSLVAVPELLTMHYLKLYIFL